MPSFLIDPRLLRACVPFASTDASRPLLNGVHVEITTGKIVIAVTDGRRLLVINPGADADGVDVIEPGNFTIPLGLLKKLPKPFSNKSPRISVSFDKGVCSIKGDDLKTSLEVMDAHYPNWRQCLPSGEQVPVKRMVFNAEYMQDFFTAAKTISTRMAAPNVLVFRCAPPAGSIIHEDSYPYIIKPEPTGGADWFGVLMPVRGDGPTLSVPEWAKS